MLKLNIYCLNLFIVAGYCTESFKENVSEKSFFDRVSFFESFSVSTTSSESPDSTSTSTRNSEQCFAFCNDDSSTICSPIRFVDVVYKRKCEDSYNTNHPLKFGENKKKVKCTPIKRDLSEQISVKIVNSSELLSQINFKNVKSYHCTVVLFYAQWCIFSMWMAPHYNALARAFPDLDVVAIDAYNFSHLNSKFGTIAVPSLMIFQKGKAFSKFNGTDRTLGSLVAYVSNNTGLEANLSVTLENKDFDGPISTVLLVQRDYCLWLAWIFLLILLLVKLFSTSRGEAILNSFIDLVNHRAGQPIQID